MYIMSRKKITISELKTILDRVKSVKNLKNDKDIAILLNISNSDFSNRKKRGTLLPLITQWAIDEKLDVDRLMKGDNGKTPVQQCIHEENASYETKASMDELLAAARKVLTSGNKMAAEMLEKNILYLARAVDVEKRTAKLKKKSNL